MKKYYQRFLVLIFFSFSIIFLYSFSKAQALENEEIIFTEQAFVEAGGLVHWYDGHFTSTSDLMFRSGKCAFVRVTVFYHEPDGTKIIWTSGIWRSDECDGMQHQIGNGYRNEYEIPCRYVEYLNGNLQSFYLEIDGDEETKPCLYDFFIEHPVGEQVNSVVKKSITDIIDNLDE
ncbi:hypothetical protein [Nonlabens sp.]|uniref:hypothetical protein n=1 Tax=Nonlabens sp. TaxID=1888209 RepID=UPI003267B4AB